MSPSIAHWTWQQVSRATGIIMALALLVAFLASFVASAVGAKNARLDPTITLAFLGIASFLIGIPSGVQLVAGRRNGSES